MSARPIDGGLIAPDTATAHSAARSAAARSTAIGIGWGLVVVLIWALWVVSTRAGVKTTLRPIDIALVRYACAALVLVPMCRARGLPWLATDARTTALLVAMAGAPFMFVSATGMRFAPASHVASLMIGAMPFFVALLALFTMRERMRAGQYAGFALLAAGLAIFVAFDTSAAMPGEWRGHALFLLSALMWAVYTIAMRKTGIGALHSAGIVNGWSLVVVALVYAFDAPPRIATIPWHELGYQAAVQTLSAVVGFYAYGEAVRRLGAARAAVLGALTPAAATALALPMLGERPDATTIAAVLLVTVGVICASVARSVARS